MTVVSPMLSQLGIISWLDCGFMMSSINFMIIAVMVFSQLMSVVPSVLSLTGHLFTWLLHSCLPLRV